MGFSPLAVRIRCQTVYSSRRFGILCVVTISKRGECRCSLACRTQQLRDGDGDKNLTSRSNCATQTTVERLSAAHGGPTEEVSHQARSPEPSSPQHLVSLHLFSAGQTREECRSLYRD